MAKNTAKTTLRMFKVAEDLRLLASRALEGEFGGQAKMFAEVCFPNKELEEWRDFYNSRDWEVTGNDEEDEG